MVRGWLGSMLLAAILLAVAGCRSLQVEAGFHTPAELTATAQAQPPASSTPAPPTATLTPVATPVPSATMAAIVTPAATLPGATATPKASAPASDMDAAVQAALGYFGAIQKRDYTTAYQLWAKGGTASGQTYDEFKKGYADTVNVSAQLGNPTEKGTGASRTVSVPVTLASVVNVPNQNQRIRRYQGTYVLQPEGTGTPSWRIASASVTETRAGTQPPSDLADPTALMRAYFDAIDGQELPRAYTYWDQLGEASGQTFPKFASGFLTTSSVAVDLGEPRIGAAAGTSYAEVPVVIVAKQADQTTRTYCGIYTDRRANVPPFDQLGWRIAGASVVSTSNVEPGSALAKKLLQGACPVPTPTGPPAPTPIAAAACTAADLTATAAVQGATGNLAGSITFTNKSSAPCILQGRPEVKLVDGTGTVLPVDEVAEPGSDVALGTPVVVAPGQTARVFLLWLVNYCGPKPTPPIGMQVTLPGEQATLSVPVTDVQGNPLSGTPRCDQPGSGNSQLSVGLFQRPE